jgi:hypothetical protein
MVSQSMPLLVGGVADAGETLVESKLLEWRRSSAASWHGDRDRLLFECSGLDYCLFAKDGGGSGHLKGEVELAPSPVLMMLGGLLRPMFLIRLDPVLRGCWLSRLIKASWLGVSPTSKSGLTTCALLLWWRRRMCVLDTCGNGSLQQYNHLFPPCFFNQNHIYL